MNEQLHPKLKIQLYTDEKCFGPGIAKLLLRVKELHSLRAAAQSMDMAYSKAWTMVKHCEAALKLKLLLYSTGGKHGGGAVLTDEALQLLDCYDRYCNALQQQADCLYRDIFSVLLDKDNQ